jgi:hypothetical protein
MKKQISLKEAYNYLIFNLQLNWGIVEEIILDKRLNITQIKGKVMVDENVLSKLIKEYDK